MEEPPSKLFLKLSWVMKLQLWNLLQVMGATFSKVVCFNLSIRFTDYSNFHSDQWRYIINCLLLIDIADGLVGVGLITQSEDMPGMLQLDKGHNDMSKFLNRILGMKVEKQNLLFKYFADTLNAIINQAKRSGKYDQVRDF